MFAHRLANYSAQPWHVAACKIGVGQNQLANIDLATHQRALDVGPLVLTHANLDIGLGALKTGH